MTSELSVKNSQRFQVALGDLIAIYSDSVLVADLVLSLEITKQLIINGVVEEVMAHGEVRH